MIGVGQIIVCNAAPPDFSIDVWTSVPKSEAHSYKLKAFLILGVLRTVGRYTTTFQTDVGELVLYSTDAPYITVF